MTSGAGGTLQAPIVNINGGNRIASYPATATSRKN